MKTMGNIRKFFLLLALMMGVVNTVKAAEAYAVYNNGTLTFYYDNNRSSRTGTTYNAGGSLTHSDYIDWREYDTSIRQVVFDSSFADARPWGTAYWFYLCNNITSIIGIQYLNTSNVGDMSWMFCGCSSLTTLDVSNFNTAKVTDMSEMFCNCSSLTTLDVSSFNTAKVTDMSEMFRGCSNLTTIYCSDSWYRYGVASGDMFTGCTKLVSPTSGLSYDSNKTGAYYANPTTGYFTYRPYAVFTGSNNTLTFYSDPQRASRPGISYYLDKYNSVNFPYWVEYKDVIQHVVFDSSFSTARPTLTQSWFNGMTQLRDITGLQYLNTEKVTSMGSMFFNCRSLTDIDLTSFNTDNVTYMGNMFTACSGLTSLDMSSFNTAKVTSMNSMFYNCSNLKTIIVGDNWTTSAVSDFYNMFYGCTSIVGRYGTRYDDSHIDKEYARLDNAPASPGYFCDINHITPITYNVQVKIENARVQITYTNNGITYRSTYEANRNITVDAHSNLIISPYKTYDNLGLASVTLNGAEIIGNLTGSGTMYDAYTISDITSDVYLAFTGEEKVDVTLKVEASAPQSHFITNTFWVRPNYDENDNLYANQSATYTLNKYSNFFFEMDNQEDPIWGITWSPAAVYVNGKDRTEDISWDMTTWFELENITSDTEIRVVFEPDCDFVRVMSLGPDLLWTRADGDERLIDCAEGDNYYVPVIKNGEGVVVRTDLIGQSPADYDVIYWKNNGRYLLGQFTMDQGGVELTPDVKNFQFKLLPGVKDQDRIIGIYPKAAAEPEGSMQKIVRHGGSSTIAYEYEYEWSAYPYPEVPVTESSPAEFILPPFNDDHGETYFSIWILLKDGESFKVYRNGDDVTELFQKGTYNTTGKYTHYSINLGNNMRDAATWNFVVEPATIDYTFIGDFNKVYATVDYGGVIDDPLDGWETAESEITVEGYYKGTIVENPMYEDADAAVLFNTTNDESFRVFRNGEEVTDQFTPVMSGGTRIAWIMHNKGALMHEPAQWVIITDSELSRYDVNRDKQISIADVTKLVNKVLNR